MKWITLWNYANNIRQVVSMTLWFFIWLSATHYMLSIGRQASNIMFYLGLAVLFTAILSSPRFNQWAKKLDQRHQP